MPILHGVRELRQETGEKVGTFVHDLPCERSHMVSIEMGRKPASIELTNMIAQKLSKLLGRPITVNRLLTGAEEKEGQGDSAQPERKVEKTGPDRRENGGSGTGPKRPNGAAA